MQAQLFSHLSLFKIFCYTSRAGDICDYMKSPRPRFFLAALLRGSARFESDQGEIFPVEEGDIVFIPQGTKYRSTWGKNGNNVYISLHFDFDPGFGFQNAETLMLQKISKESAKGLLKKLESAYELYSAGGTGELSALACFYEVLATVLPLLRRAARPVSDRRLSPAIDYIRSHLSEDPPVSRLARLCGMSEPNLYLLFRRSLGESPVEYKNRLRIEHAMHLLETQKDLPIEQIADAAGFESAAYFRRRFKEHTGESPRDFRKRSAEKL